MYRVDLNSRALEQLRLLFAAAKKRNQLQIMKSAILEAVRRIESDPQGAGDPKWRAKSSDGIVYVACLRPLAITYVVFEEAAGVVLMNVIQYADFS